MAERRRHRPERPGWTWHHLVVLAAVFVLLGVLAYSIAQRVPESLATPTPSVTLKGRIVPRITPS